MPKLAIIVPHYKEPWSVCKYLFDTLATQRGISFDDIHVIVVNDGDSEQEFRADDLNANYPFRTDVYTKPHEGISATRNYGLCMAKEDYVMFCDADDGFLNNWGLYLVFQAMQEGFDLFVASFAEEVWLAEDKTLTAINHVNDPTFIHGKVYRREYLIEHDLFFDDDLTIHEDGYFNHLVYTEVMHDGKFKTEKSPIYIWRYNDQSVVRKDKKDFVLRTYDHVVESRIRLCRQLKQRGFDEDFRTAVCVTVVDVFYDFQKPNYRDPANVEYIQKAERAFKAFWDEFKSEFFECTNKEIAEVIRGVRDKAYTDGMLYEQFGLQTWLRHIANDVR